MDLPRGGGSIDMQLARQAGVDLRPSGGEGETAARHPSVLLMKEGLSGARKPMQRLTCHALALREVRNGSNPCRNLVVRLDSPLPLLNRCFG